jgi:hypothetical protein
MEFVMMWLRSQIELLDNPAHSFALHFVYSDNPVISFCYVLSDNGGQI